MGMDSDQDARMKIETIRSDLIPGEFKQELSAILMSYSVNLVGLRAEAEYAHCGSGTLVRDGDRRCILTAAHCAEELLKWDALGLVLVDYPHRFLIPSGPPPVFIDTRGSDEWGPDLAFLAIPPNKVGTIESVKSFYNLPLREGSMRAGKPDIERGLWAFVGAPASTSNLAAPGNLEFAQTAHWAFVDRLHAIGDHDYVDVGIPADASNLPASFKGVSGGGLWQIDIFRDLGGRWGMTVPTLEGCAFYETAPANARIHIRCHGRRSIYVRAIEQLRRAG
jgi:hypothetical protein